MKKYIYVPKNALVTKISPKKSGCFGNATINPSNAKASFVQRTRIEGHNDF